MIGGGAAIADPSIVPRLDAQLDAESDPGQENEPALAGGVAVRSVRFRRRR
jgi:hypothetical protein